MLKEEWMVYYSLPSYIGYIVVISHTILKDSKKQSGFQKRRISLIFGNAFTMFV